MGSQSRIRIVRVEQRTGHEHKLHQDSGLPKSLARKRPEICPGSLGTLMRRRFYHDLLANAGEYKMSEGES
jgi:hypothetical protein